MCEANAYIYQDGKEELYLESVDIMRPEEGKIYLRNLFGVQKLADVHTADDLPSHPMVRKWWDFMADIMEVNPDNSPVCKPLAEVFHAE
jgi:L-rhamnose mutarotase